MPITRKNNKKSKQQAREKYEANRVNIRNGDIAVFRGSSFISRQIQEFDEAYYNHTGLVFESNKRLLVIDSNAGGVKPDFLSTRMDEYSDFCIVRPAVWSSSRISIAVAMALERAQSTIRYDFDLLLQIAIYRKTGKNIDLNSENKDICSEYCRRYIRYLSEPTSLCFEQPNMPTGFITPWDFIIYADSNFKIMFDDSDHHKYRKK